MNDTVGMKRPMGQTNLIEYLLVGRTGAKLAPRGGARVTVEGHAAQEPRRAA